MKIGAHAVLFRERIASETADILTGMAKAGFEVAEMGARFFSLDKKGQLLEALEQSGIELAGLHVAAPFPELAVDKDAVMERVLNAAQFLQDMPNRNIIFSSMQPEGVDIAAAARNLEEIAQRCLEMMGVKINYHNHAHEFENNMAIFSILLETAPNLLFGMDLGWVYKGGCNPIEVFSKYSERIPYVHLRDANETDFTELGEGNFDYPKLMAVLQNAWGNEGWAVVEYEHGEADMQRYAKAREFLKGLGY